MTYLDFEKEYIKDRPTEPYLEQASAEASVTTQSIASQLVMQIEPLKRKQEATTL